MMVNRCSILLKIAKKNWPSIRHRNRNTDHQIAVLIQPRMIQGLRMLRDEDSGAPPGCSDGGDHSASARAIEGLARDPEIAASAGHIAGAAIDIHPGDDSRFPGSVPRRCEPVGPHRRGFPLRICISKPYHPRPSAFSSSAFWTIVVPCFG